MSVRLYYAAFGQQKPARPAKPKARVRKLDAPEVEWYELRAKVFARDKFTCVYCRTRFGDRPDVLHADHVHPVSRGGLSTIENLATACASCNSSKGAKTVEEWRQ